MAIQTDETMVVLPEEEKYETDIHGKGLDTDAEGGIDGEANTGLRGLANRTAWLKKVYDALALKVGDLSRFAFKNGSSSNRFKVADANANNEAVSKAQLNSAIDNIDVDTSGLVKKSGDTMTGNLTIDGKGLYVYKSDARTRTYIQSNDIVLDSKFDVDADRKYMMLNMFDSASGFKMYPRGGTAIEHNFSQDSWKLDGSRLLTHKGIHKTHNNSNGADARIVNENFGGDTGIGLLKENVNLIKHGRKVSAEFKLTLNGFSKSLPSNSDYYFEYDLLGKIKEALGNAMDGTAYGISKVVPSPALFYFYKYDPKKAAMMQLAETWMITGSRVKFYIDNPAGRADGSSLTVDRVDVQFTFEILLNKD